LSALAYDNPRPKHYASRPPQSRECVWPTAVSTRRTLLRTVTDRIVSNCIELHNQWRMTKMKQTIVARNDRPRFVLDQCKHAAENGLKCPSDADFMEMMKCGGDSVRATFLSLTKNGLIKVQRMHKGKVVEIVSSGLITAGHPMKSLPVHNGAKDRNRMNLDQLNMLKPPPTYEAPTYPDRNPCYKCGANPVHGCVHNPATAQ
jgi:hypothetical protein